MDTIRDVITLLSLIMSFISLPVSLIALAIWHGHKLSTHKVTMMPIEQVIAKNLAANKAFNQAMNQENEDESEYSNILKNMEPDNFMPNSLNKRTRNDTTN